MKFLTKSFVLFTLFCLIITPSFTQENSALDIKYKRSSLYTLILNNDTIEYSDNIKTSFINTPIPYKFNDHITSSRVISFTDLVFKTKEVTQPKKKGLLSKLSIKSSDDKKKEREDLQKVILNYLDSINLAKSLVAKWFNRSAKGGFNMDLIAERGLYNASYLDIKIANQSERGRALLADAGEELIKNSFVIVNDYKYTNKEEVAKQVKSFLSSASNVASRLGNNSIGNSKVSLSTGVDVFGKGYVVKTTAYLYKLAWTDEVAATFYNDFWTDDGALDKEKKKAFDDTSIFKLELVGIQTGWADVQSTFISSKSNKELIEIATVRAADNVIAKLQREYEVFRTKTPLLSGDPLSAKIGLKEGLEKGHKYEVLEQILKEDGLTEYKRVGVITVDKEHIWDNRYLAEEEKEKTFSKLNYTLFKGTKNKFYSGMLIRQIN